LRKQGRALYRPVPPDAQTSGANPGANSSIRVYLVRGAAPVVVGEVVEGQPTLPESLWILAVRRPQGEVAEIVFVVAA
jgi:hypothetical protein